MTRELREVLWSIVAASLLVMTFLHLVIGASSLDTMKEDIAVQEQIVAELRQTLERVSDRIGKLEGREIMLIMRAGREITIRTADGQVLRCYFPDREDEEGESND